jgi:adenylate cyclase
MDWAGARLQRLRKCYAAAYGRDWPLNSSEQQIPMLPIRGSVVSLVSSITPTHTLAARRALEESLSADPGSAEAWSELSSILASDYLNRWNGADAAVLDQAELAAQQALKIDPSLAFAHFANGFVHQAKGEHLEALECFDRAIEYDPNFARAYAYKGAQLVNVGRLEEAPSLVMKAIELSPNDPSLGVFYWIIGRSYFFAGRYSDAIPWLQKSIEVRPNLWYNRLYLVSES